MIPLYKKYADTKAIAYINTCFTQWGGIEILDIEHGIDDVAIACFNFGKGRQDVRRHKIYTSRSGRTYIRKQGQRYYLDEAMKVQ